MHSGKDNSEIEMVKTSTDPNLKIASWTKMLAISTFALVAVTLIGAIINVMQWAEIHKSSADAKILAEYAKSQAMATGMLAELTKQQADASAIQLRAWIGTTGLEMSPLNIGEGIDSDLSYQNFGKQSAIVMHWAQDYIYPTDGRWEQLLKDDAEDNARACKLKTMTDQSPDRAILFPANPIINRHITEEKVDQEIIEGKRIYVRFDCFAYLVGKDIKHSQTCYYFINNQKQPMIPGICSVGEFYE